MTKQSTRAAEQETPAAPNDLISKGSLKRLIYFQRIASESLFREIFPEFADHLWQRWVMCQGVLFIFFKGLDEENEALFIKAINELKL